MCNELTKINSENTTNTYHIILCTKLIFEIIIVERIKKLILTNKKCYSCFGSLLIKLLVNSIVIEQLGDTGSL